MNFEPLCVSCRPHALYYERDRWLKLDSLLLKAALVEKYGAAFAALPPIFPSTPAEQLEYPDMPLERRERHGQWYYACSWADVEAATVQTFASAYVRRFSEQAVRKYASNRRLVVHTGKGADKSVQEVVRWRIVSELTWYAVGDIAEIKRLLEAHYSSIGKKESQGCGQLCPYPNGDLWRVEASSSDYSERDATGKPTRGLPVARGGVLYPVRPPYYVRADYALLELPR